MKMHSEGAFALIDVLMGLIMFGMLLAVLMPTLAGLNQLTQAGRQMGRKGATTPLNESLIAQGFNPASAGITDVAVLEQVRASAPALTKSVWSNQAGSSVVYLINGETGLGTSQKLEAFGFQLGRGTDAAPRGQIVPATPPITIAAPSLSPSGQNITITSFLVPPVNPGDPWSVQISATAADPLTIARLRFSGISAHSATGIASASFTLTAAEVMQGGTVQAWDEFNGVAGDTAQVLSDGRTRWWTATNVYEPSAIIAQNYRVSIGSPVLFINGIPFQTGATIPVTWDLRTSLVSAYVGYDPAEIAKLGSSPISNYSAQFNAVAVTSAPDVSLVFSDAMLPSWTASNSLSAQPLGLPSGLDAPAANWVLAQSAITLDDPDLVTAAYDVDYALGGMESFEAPLRGANRVGRVRVGDTFSLGPLLTVPVGP